MCPFRRIFLCANLKTPISEQSKPANVADVGWWWGGTFNFTITAIRTKILSQFSGFDRSNPVSPSKRYLHKWCQNTSFLPVPPAKQVNHRSNLCNYDLLSPVYQAEPTFLNKKAAVHRLNCGFSRCLSSLGTVFSIDY